MAGTARDLLIKLLVDDTELDKIEQSKGRFDKFSDGLSTASMWSAGALGVLGGAAFATMEDLKAVEVINAQTSSAIESTGGAAGVTAEHVEELAGRLEGMTATEGEAIQEGANLLLTFTNIKNGTAEGSDIFDQATESLVDMSRAMGSDPQQAATQLGKALNDPIAGVGALSKVGVQFTDDQKAMIEEMVLAGDVAGAQGVILGELNTQFGGSGENYAETAAGKQELLGHKIGETSESIVTSLMPAVSDFLDVALDMATWASENSELLGVIVGSVAGLAAGILVLNGVVKAWTAIQAIQTAVQWAQNAAWLANPTTWIILAIVVAIGLLVAAGVWLYQNWDQASAWLADAWTNIVAAFEWGVGMAVGYLQHVGESFATVFGAIGQFFSDLWAGFIADLEKIGAFIVFVFEYASAFIQQKLTAVGQFASDTWNGFIAHLQMVGTFALSIFQGVGDFVASTFVRIGDNIASWWGQLGQLFVNIGAFFVGFWQNIVTGAQGAVDWISSSVDSIVGFFSSIPDRIGQAWTGLVDLLRTIMSGIITVLINAWNATLGSIDQDLPAWLGGGTIKFDKLEMPALATGGIVTGPTVALIGEAGREAVVPLDRAAEFGFGRGAGDGSGPLMAEVPFVIKLDSSVLARGVKRVALREGWA